MTAGSLADVVEVLAGHRLAVLTGAGVSTDSGIPDYRGPDSPPRTPMTFQQFTSDEAFRRHYWARNHVGWRHVHRTMPNAGHRALAALEHRGVVTGLITQNVDLLHEAAGSRHVIDLHGRYDRVRCLSCGTVISRAELADRLDTLNPGFTAARRGHRDRARRRRRHRADQPLRRRGLQRVRRDAQAGHRLLRRERAARAGGAGVRAGRRGRRAARRRVVADRAVRAAVRAARRADRQAGGRREPGRDPRATSTRR